MPLEIGNCSTVASLPKLPPMTLPWDCSKANLNVGSSFPDKSGSGTLFLKGKSVMLPVCDIASLLLRISSVIRRNWNQSLKLEMRRAGSSPTHPQQRTDFGIHGVTLLSSRAEGRMKKVLPIAGGGPTYIMYSVSRCIVSVGERIWAHLEMHQSSVFF
jgi:hypothetical protein